MCAKKGVMNYRTIVLFLALLVGVSCKETTTGPISGVNLLSNSTFEINGLPSFQGWIVPDTSVVHFSTDIPSAGSGRSVVFGIGSLGDPWPSNSIYAAITGLSGTHQYRLSVFGKTDRIISGGVFAYRNRPLAGNSIPFSSLLIADTVWASYSYRDTLSVTPRDTIFINITGGVAEVVPLTSIYFNTCTFEKLD
jgi:hypothetical protein